MNKLSGQTFTAYAAGTAYTLTATPALLDFGTTDPTLTLPQGKWLILAQATVDPRAATGAIAGVLKLRKTSGVAADLDDSPANWSDNNITDLSGAMYTIPLPPVVFRALQNDVIELFGSASTGTGVTVVAASIVAIRIGNSPSD